MFWLNETPSIQYISVCHYICNDDIEEGNDIADAF